MKRADRKHVYELKIGVTSLERRTLQQAADSEYESLSSYARRALRRAAVQTLGKNPFKVSK